MATYYRTGTFTTRQNFVGDPVNTITLTNASFFNFDVSSEGGDDTWVVTDTSTQFSITSGDGNDDITVGGTSDIGYNVNGQVGDDVITITDTAVVQRDVVGGAGNDTININGDAQVGWDGVGLPSYSDGIFTGTGVPGTNTGDVDTVNVSGNAIVGNIYGGDGVDNININGDGTNGVQIGYWVTGNGGADNISVDGTVTLGAIQGEGGNAGAGTGTGDIITIEAGSNVTLFGIGGGTGDDIISVYGSGSTDAAGGGRGYGGNSYYTGFIRGDEGADTITIGESFEVDGVVEGGDGDDRISILDTATVAGTIGGGDAADTIIISSVGQSGIAGGQTFDVDGGSTSFGGADNDTLDVRGLFQIFGAPTTLIENPDGTGSSSGTIAFAGGPTITFAEIESLLVCFTTGTRIATIDGEMPIEDIAVGDLVTTADNGYQAVRWIGRRKISAKELEKNPSLYPVRIRRGAIGPSMPERDMLVSPQHRILIKSVISERMFEADEVLVAAKHLTAIDGIDVADDVTEVEYVHFLCAQHEVVFAEGLSTESLYTGKQALASLHSDAVNEIFTIFPELLDMDAEKLPAPARLLVQGRRGRRLAERHHTNKKPLYVADRVGALH